MSKSIRYYYFTSIATVLVASVLIMGLIQTYLAITYFRDEKEAQLEKVVGGVQGIVASGLLSEGDAALHNADFVNFMASFAGVEAMMVSPEGKVVFATGNSGDIVGREVSPELLVRVDKNGSYHEMGRMEGFFSTNFYTYAVPLIGPEGMLKGYVFASADASGIRVYLTDMLSSFVLSAGLVLLVSSILALVLANRTIIPVRRVSEAARQFGEGNYATRVPVEGDDEMAMLAVTFNDMANSFEATDASRRSFMGNIAHELRTPMTSIKGFIDGMLDGTIPENQRDKYLGIVSQEVGRLARLTQNMLDISKLETGEYAPNTTVFNVWVPITSAFLAAEQRLTEGRIGVRGIEDTSLPVLGDEDFVHQILFNLIDNAVKFAGEGGEIAVEAKQIKNMVTVSISNTGDGIPPEALPYVFDRFYKEDKSRGVNAGGSGLGLHISKVLVGLMGGRIWAESEPGVRTCFHFTLPAAPQKRK